MGKGTLHKMMDTGRIGIKLDGCMSEIFSKLFTPAYWAAFFKQRKAFFAKIARISVSATRGFSDDDCSLKASALTYYSILSIVPVLAVAFGIAKGFGFEKHLENLVTEKLLEQKELSEKIISFAYSALQSAQGGLIAGVGVIILFWTVLKLLSNIESSFNAIWKIRKSRPLSRRFSDYLAMMIFCPIFFAASSSISIFVVTQVASYSQSHGFWETVSPMITLAFQIFPLILAWVLFTALYLVMPNTKVPVSCAVAAGVIAGTAFQIVQWAYINFQLGITSYGAIYGSFAALPLLILWINISWLITLMGAEIAYHAENDIALSKRELSQEHRIVDERIIGLTITGHCIDAFYRNSPPLTLYDLAHLTGIPVVTARNVVEQLKDEGILSEVRWGKNNEESYQPGRDVKGITVQAVCNALDSSRHTFHEAVWDRHVRIFQKKLELLDELMEKAPENALIAKGEEKENLPEKV